MFKFTGKQTYVYHMQIMLMDISEGDANME